MKKYFNFSSGIVSLSFVGFGVFLIALSYYCPAPWPFGLDAFVALFYTSSIFIGFFSGLSGIFDKNNQYKILSYISFIISCFLLLQTVFGGRLS